MRLLTFSILMGSLLLSLGACQQKEGQDIFFQTFFDRTQDELDQNIVYDIARTKDIVYEKRQLNLLYQSMEKVYNQSKIILHKIEGIRNNLNRESNYKNQITKDLDSLLFFGRHLLLDELKELVQEAEEIRVRGVKFEAQAIDQLQEDLLLADRKLEEYKSLGLNEADKDQIELILNCFEQETIMSAAQIINFIRANTNIGGSFPRWQIYYPIALSPKPAVSFGEIYEADIFLGSFRSQEDFSVKVNGKDLIVEEGKAHFKDQPKGLGEHSYEVKIKLKDYKTGKIQTVSRNFYYQVVEAFAQISSPNQEQAAVIFAQLSNGQGSGKIKAASMQLEKSLQANATIQSFELTYTPKGGLPQTFKNKGEVFQKEILEAIKKAKVGDLFLFHNIKGEKGQLNSMGFIVN